ncbi:MAG: substrate-binding domain-containing protein [Gammaproteobacteria bacterium]|jgi:phosphate transport system substrate-binding protein|nr:substrate-binding domain-containing protein [Gammaproteobacteria bacterium]
MSRILCIALLVIPFTLHAADGALLRLHGSNTIGSELAPDLVASWLLSEGFSNIQVVPVADESIEIHGTDRQGRLQTVEILSHGSGTGFTSIAEGKADIAMSSRAIKEDELDLLADFGDMTSHKAEYIIGLDGIAVIVNQKNPIQTIQKHQLAKIFTGEIQDWQQIDPAMKGPVHVYARDDKSGTYDTFKSLVLGKGKLISNARRYESSSQLSDDVAQDNLAIGFIGLPYVRQARALGVSEAGAMARYPEMFDVATEDYALARRLYMYVPTRIQNPQVNSFMTFVMSGLGQALVQDNGFIAQKIIAQTVKLDQGLPEEYLVFTQNGERLSLNIRFHKGSVAVDTKAHHDLNRLVEYMKSTANRDKKIMLFGFSDETRSIPEYSEDLATHRVDRVADLLVRKGLDPIRVRAYGSANPVASNEDVAGRFKNRRVEIWIQ